MSRNQIRDVYSLLHHPLPPLSCLVVDPQEDALHLPPLVPLMSSYMILN